MTCPCEKEMKNLGNISGNVYLGVPESWDEVYTCESCKTIKTLRVQGEVKHLFDELKKEL